MDLSMFLVFPGILITIGVGLLFLSIIIVIIAYKTADKKVLNNLEQNNYSASIPNNNLDNKEHLTPFVPEMSEPEISSSENTVSENSLEETKIFNIQENLKPEIPEQHFIKAEPQKIIEKPKEIPNEPIKLDIFEEEFEKSGKEMSFDIPNKQEETFEISNKSEEPVSKVEEQFNFSHQEEFKPEPPKEEVSFSSIEVENPEPKQPESFGFLSKTKEITEAPKQEFSFAHQTESFIKNSNEDDVELL